MNLARMKNYSIKLAYKISDEIPVAHHGIQRSGTNYLNLCLTSLGIKPINCFDPERNHPTHKHFRWQENKRSIMHWEEMYKNNIFVSKLEELNLVCKYPQSTRHIVIKKDFEEWTCSILNWGLRVGWFKTKSEAKIRIVDVCTDYCNYYEFWEHIESERPESVNILQYEILRSNPEIIFETLNTLGISKYNHIDYTGNFNVVPQSPELRANRFSVSEVKGLLENLNII